MGATTSIEGKEKVVEGMRERILAAALDLLNTGGRDALTTRAVAEAAGVQPVSRQGRHARSAGRTRFRALSCPEAT